MPDPQAKPKQRRTFFQRYGLSVVLAFLFLISWGAQAVFQWFEVANEAEQHGTSVTVGDYVWSFGQSTFENWQSEFLQLLAFVVLTAFLVHVGSPESRDSDEETQAALERIEAHVLALEAQLSRAAGAPTELAGNSAQRRS